MALTGSGQISIGDIAGEFGGSAPHALSEYYDKGNAPASGEIQVAADFYGTANAQTLTYSGGVSEVVATDNSSTDVSTGSHIVMGLNGRSNGQGGGNMGGQCSSVNCNGYIQIKVRSKAVHGASGALSRGSISEVGPTNVGTGSGCQINVWGNQACSSNKFLVGIRVNSIPHSFTCNWYGNNQFQIYAREASMSSAVHNGSTTYSSDVTSARNAYGGNSDLGSTRFGTGYSISTGSSGEFTDNQGWAWFGYRVFGQDAIG